MKAIIPKEVTAHLEKVRTVRIAAFAALLVVLLFLMILQPGFIGEFHAGNKMFFALFYLIAVIILTGVPKIFFDKSWEGVVTDVKIDSVWESKNPTKPTRESIRYVNHVYLTVSTPDGETVYHEVGKYTPKHTDAVAETYHPGDYVMHLAGTKFLALYRDHKTTRTCIFCGMQSPLSEDTCSHCGKKLIEWG